jgi:assimilatory nitrate reductase catalytic subunit
MHWGSEFMSGLGVNAMMPAAFDKTSKQPELKHTAIKIEKLTLPWQMTVMRSIQDLSALQQLRAFLSKFAYASCGLFGRQQPDSAGMLIFRAAHETAPDQAMIAEIDAILGMTDDKPLLNYHDGKRGISKRILVEAAANSAQKVTGVRLVGETIAADWLQEVMSSGEFTADIRKWALAPLSAPPAAHPGRGKIVCNCLDVSENEIIDSVPRGADLITLQNKLKCGTECGSCVPELKRIIKVYGRA